MHSTAAYALHMMMTCYRGLWLLQLQILIIQSTSDCNMGLFFVFLCSRVETYLSRV